MLAAARRGIGALLRRRLRGAGAVPLRRLRAARAGSDGLRRAGDRLGRRCAPEVVGGAGLLVAPDNALAWREACLRVFRDEALRRQLAAAGQERASRFSWDDCARQVDGVRRLTHPATMKSR